MALHTSAGRARITRRSRILARILSLVAALAAGTAASTLAAPVFQGDIPDFFQHQKWGADANAHADWEKEGGWCHQTAILDLMYFWKKKGIAVLADSSTQQPKWLAAHNQELPVLFDNYAKWLDPTKRPADADSAQKEVEDVLNFMFHRRGAGPLSGVNKGVRRQSYYQLGKHVGFTSATGETLLFRNKTLYDRLKDVVAAKDGPYFIVQHPNQAMVAKVAAIVDKFVATKSLTAAERAYFLANEKEASKISGKVWWASSFHAVAVAGYDDGANPKHVWFADPDCNPTAANAHGNKNSDGGWTNIPANQDPKDANSPIKKRRFAATDAIPVPAAAGADAKRYFDATLAAAKTTFAIADAEYDRYDKIDIQALYTIEVNRAAKKKPAGGGPALARSSSTPHVFQISPGQVGGPPVDEFWVFPASDLFTGAISFDRPNWSYEFLPPFGLDPWENLREYGGVRCYSNSPSDALTDTTVIEMTYTTASGLELDGWDAALNDRQAGGPLRYQTGGGEPVPFPVQPIPVAVTAGPDLIPLLPGATHQTHFDLCSTSTEVDTFVCRLWDIRGWGRTDSSVVILEPGECVTVFLDTLTTPLGTPYATQDTLFFAANTLDERAPASGLAVIVAALPVSDSADPAAALRFGLGTAMPNPMSAVTRIRFALAERGVVTLTVHDVTGRKVRTLVDGVRDPGADFVMWNGRSDSGQRVAAGTYFVRLQTEREVATDKIVIVP